MTRLIKVDLIVWIKLHAFGGSCVTSKIQVYLVIVTRARPRGSTKYPNFKHHRVLVSLMPHELRMVNVSSIHNSGART